MAMNEDMELGEMPKCEKWKVTKCSTGPCGLFRNPASPIFQYREQPSLEKNKQAKSEASAVSMSVDPQKFVSSSFVSMTLVAVYCELGQFSAAKNTLSFERADSRYHTWFLQARERRIKVATAQVYLMEGLWCIKSNNFGDAEPLLNQARILYQELQKFYEASLSLA
jgi:hypothetical protein